MALMRMRNETKTELRVLVVEKLARDREAITTTFEEAGIAVLEATDGLRGWTRFRGENPHAVVAGFELAGLSGLGLLQRVRRVSTVPFVFEASRPDVAKAVMAVREGADDVLCLPDDLEIAADKVRALVDVGARGRAARVIQAQVVGRSRGIARLRERLCAVANLRVPVLLRGEAGSGRSHAVRAILEAGGLDPARLCVVRPGAPPTSDPRSAPGPWYLKGVEGLAPPEQARWAALLGAVDRESADSPPRVFASTSADLETLARQGRFHPLLATHLARFAIELPPLRRRPTDVGPLAAYLAARAAARMGRARVVFTAPALRLLQRQSWPGNVRELEAVVEKLVAFSPDGQVSLRHAGAVLRERPASVAALRREADRRQREELLAQLNATGGNLAEAARRLGMSRGAIIYRAQKFGLLPRKS